MTSGEIKKLCDVEKELAEEFGFSIKKCNCGDGACRSFRVCGRPGFSGGYFLDDVGGMLWRKLVETTALLRERIEGEREAARRAWALALEAIGGDGVCLIQNGSSVEEIQRGLVGMVDHLEGRARFSERRRVLNEAADWFTMPDFAQSNVELGFRRRCAGELRELAKRDQFADARSLPASPEVKG